MKTTKKEKYIEITPKKGKWLTQAELEDEMQRVFSESVYIPLDGDTKAWREADEAEKTAWEEEQAKRQEDLSADYVEGELG